MPWHCLLLLGRDQGDDGRDIDREISGSKPVAEMMRQGGNFDI